MGKSPGYHFLAFKASGMKNLRKTILFLLFFSSLLNNFLQGQNISPEASGNPDLRQLLSGLNKIPGIKYHELPAKAPFVFALELMIPQPVDQLHPCEDSFFQRVFLSHVDMNAPVVLETEGYGLRQNTPLELSSLLEANQVQVEYRYYGKSKPFPVDYQYLTNRQGVEDLHRIRTLLGKIYKGKWMSTGISKGGVTTLMYRRFYPRDVKASVAYVAPLIIGTRDPRTDYWQQSAGDSACREKIRNFQRACLERRDEILPLWVRHGKENGLSFSIGEEVAYEYAVLEYPFSFWQWGHQCETIPEENASASDFLIELLNVSGTGLYTDRGIAYYEPSFYQHLTESGYYGFPHEHLADLLHAVKEPDNAVFAPKGVPLEFNPDFIPDILNWLDRRGNKIIYVYGELDTWTACAVEPNPKRDALKLTVKNGSHSSRIRHLSRQQQSEVFEKLEKWLKLDIVAEKL